MDELQLRDKWMAQAKTMTADKLPDFIKELSEHKHDYGTICRAIAAAGVAAMHSVDRQSGGITGFQAGCVIWDVIDGWPVWGNGPKRMLEYEHLLYPQYEEQFTSISPDTWNWVQEKAKTNLKEMPPGASGKVLNHWQDIANGKVPFGFTVKDT